ncbi:methyltransferase [Phycisphaeraceae bacterium D3-23]
MANLPPPAPLIETPYCPGCGYNLRGQPAADLTQCPECGGNWAPGELLDRPPPPAVSSAQWTLAGIITALTVFILGYRLLVLNNLYQTSAFFIGLPALLAITLALTTRAKTATGICFKVTTMTLLISGIFLGEGFICCVMMAPLFFIVAGIIGMVIDHYHYRPKSGRLRLLLLPLLLLMALEGVSERLSFSPHATASATRLVDAPPHAVREQLANTPRFDRPMPALLQAGFPTPLEARGQGLNIGDSRNVVMGVHGHTGELALAVTENSEQHIRFKTLSDTTKISEWLAWRSATVELQPVGESQTRVTWTLHYERRLAPAWYFGPFQKIATTLAAGSLIDNLATPPAAQRTRPWQSPGLIRSLSLLAPVLLALILSAVYRRRRRLLIGAWLSLAWAFPAVVILNLVAIHGGWWSFNAQGAMWLGMPVDLLLGWAILWSVVPALLAPRLPLPIVALVLLWLDLLLMPWSAPVVQLGPMWQYADLAALCVVLVPAQWLARWTRQETHLPGRVLIHLAAFTGLFLVCIPLVLMEHTDLTLDGWRHQPGWLRGLWMQALALAALPGLAGVAAFYRYGKGTAVPYDPPKQLVTQDVYAYVRNPMQLALVLIYTVMAGALMNAWLLMAAGVVLAYGFGLARWHEDQQLRARYGEDWRRYRAAVRAWWPRFRPYVNDPQTPAIVYIDHACKPCAGVARWLERRAPVGLQVLDAQDAPGPLQRMTYQAGPTSPPEPGVAAIAACLQHLHLGWAAMGWALKLPGIRGAAQLLTDAAGGGQAQTRPAKPRHYNP